MPVIVACFGVLATFESWRGVFDPVMTDYQALLQTIRALQPTRLGYIELLQEEVKRSRDVSSGHLAKEGISGHNHIGVY